MIAGLRTVRADTHMELHIAIAERYCVILEKENTIASYSHTAGLRIRFPLSFGKIKNIGRTNMLKQWYGRRQCTLKLIPGLKR